MQITSFGIAYFGPPMPIGPPATATFKPCTFIGTLSNFHVQSGGLPSIVYLNLEGIIPDDTDNLFHYQAGKGFQLRSLGGPPIGYPFGTSTMIIWQVPDGTRAVGTLDLGQLGSGYSFEWMIWSVEAYSEYNPAEYQFNGKFRSYNSRQINYGVRACDVEYTMSEANGKSFGWAVSFINYSGSYGPEEHLLIPGAGDIDGVIQGFQTMPAFYGLALWAHPDPDAQWIDYGSKQNNLINEFYGWQLIATM